jgi:SPP1 gp7 family putative phage head morphogenesis protein
MFPNEADVAEFDTDDIDVLQEARSEEWGRSKEQITVGAITVNEWRDEQGLEPVEWGDSWWAPSTLLPVTDSSLPAQTPASAPPTEEPAPPRTQTRAIEYGSPEHQRIWNRFARKTTEYEKQVTRVTEDLFKRQRYSVLSRLKQRAARSPQDALDEPFDMAQWVKAFRTEIRPVLTTIIGEVGQDALDELAIIVAFNLTQPAVARFIERRAQRFAQAVNETTWNALKSSLSEGIKAGEDILKLSDRVTEVMAERIRSTPETIARTEVIGAANGGTLEAWRQSDVVEKKVWLAALDDRTRHSHIEAHGQTRDLDEDFEVGAGRGPVPGQIGRPEEDINCRCTITAEVKA